MKLISLESPLRLRTRHLMLVSNYFNREKEITISNVNDTRENIAFHADNMLVIWLILSVVYTYQQ
jgi:hypothetical protein